MPGLHGEKLNQTGLELYPVCDSKVVNNELIFFRKFSDPDTRKDKEDEPRLHYYKIKILQVSIERESCMTQSQVM